MRRTKAGILAPSEVSCVMKLRLSHNFMKVTLPVHCLFVLSLYFMPTHLSWFHVATWLPLWTLISGLGIAVGYHRLLSHRSFQCSLWTRRILALLGSLAGQGSPAFWVATHRGLHHPYSDTDRDPHTPKKGAFHAFFGWQLRFSEKDFSIRHCTDIVRDPFLKALSLHYYKIYWLLLALMFLVDSGFFLFGLVPVLVFSIHQENLVNWLSHTPGFGYRNFEIDDQSNNHRIFAMITWGQALHNNHHKYPNRYNFSVKKGEIDPSALLIDYILRGKQKTVVGAKKVSL